jgi:dTDP-4-amino-4,6-dideoxygalactose transaminase
MNSQSLQFIPLTKPYLSGNEIAYVSAAIENIELVGDGPNTRQAEAQIAEISQSIYAFFAPSCTDALDMCSMLLELEPGDEVIVPGFTFTSTATAFAQQKATLVFADVDPRTLNIDPTHAESLITAKTRAIVVVHYAGIACDMEAFVALAKRNDLVLIEDNAHGFGAKYKDKALGSIGAMATLSFHVTKNVQCGEGGALLTSDKSYADRAHILREKGTNRRAFLEGSVDKYTWVDQGSSFLAPDYVAAFLLAQMDSFDHIHRQREHAWNRYHLELGAWADGIDATLPTIPEYACHPSHLFWLTLSDKSQRPNFMSFLKNKGIGAAFHYQSLANSPAGKRFGRTDGTPIADATAETLVRLPLFASITDSEIDRVIAAVKEWSR